MDVYATANILLDKYGLAQQGWRFELDNAKKRAGCCKRQIKMITLSKHYVSLNLADRPEDILDTILHEIAHALSPRSGHGPEWKAICVQIGAKPIRCYDSQVVIMPKGKVIAVCSGCSKTFYRHRLVRRNRIIWCAACGPDRGKLEFKSTTITAVKLTGPINITYTPPPSVKLRGT